MMKWWSSNMIILYMQTLCTGWLQKFVDVKNTFRQSRVQRARKAQSRSFIEFSLHFLRENSPSSISSSFRANVLNLMQLFQRQRTKFYWVTVRIHQYPRNRTNYRMFNQTSEPVNNDPGNSQNTSRKWGSVNTNYRIFHQTDTWQ